MGRFPLILRSETFSDRARRRRRYSPAVLRLAEEREVDLDQIEGTGYRRTSHTQGRSPIPGSNQSAIALKVPDDSSSEPSQQLSHLDAADERVLSDTPFRRMIAENMVRSATEIPSGVDSHRS